jgi:hypothetical protein
LIKGDTNVLKSIKLILNVNLFQTTSDKSSRVKYIDLSTFPNE